MISAVKEIADAGNIPGLDLEEQLTRVEGLIREGYLGEARFTIRKILENQMANPEDKLPATLTICNVLEKLNQKLLMSRSLEDLRDTTDLIDQARYLYRFSSLPFHSPEKIKAACKFFSGRKLRILFRVS